MSHDQASVAPKSPRVICRFASAVGKAFRPRSETLEFVERLRDCVERKLHAPAGSPVLSVESAQRLCLATGCR